jgi:hypothetical protein
VTTATGNEAEVLIEGVMKALDTAFEPDPIQPTTWKQLVRPYVASTFTKALAAERRATVERVRRRLANISILLTGDHNTAEFMPTHTAERILDEEAAGVR